jgi:hypothetical protein
MASTRSSVPSLRLGRSYELVPEPDGFPLFALLPLVACWRYEPPEHLRPLAIARAAIGSATPITIDFNLPVYSSQRPLPDATQDSVRGCSLGCAAAVIADGRLQRACKAQSAQIRACATNALGSYFEYLTWDRWFGHGCSTLGDGKNRLISRIIRSHVSRRRWLRRRKLRNQIMLV